MEYTNLFGSEHLIPAYDRMHWVLYYSVDILIYIVVIIFAIFFVIRKFYYLVVAYVDKMYAEELKAHAD